MNKEKICNAIIANLEDKLATAISSANNAHLDAIDDQSVAETQYDTLAIEASYLAEGQSRRVDELKLAVKQITALKKSLLTKVGQSEHISIGNIVAIIANNAPTQTRWFFLSPCAAGLTLTLENKQLTVITPQSPLGQQFLHAYIDDEINLPTSDGATLAIINDVI